MPCYHPLVATRKLEGGVAILRAKKHCDLDIGEFVVPCGQCIGCRNDKAKSWAVRCIHEERINRERGFESSFLTLTYEDHNLPDDGTLDPNDHTEFVNKLKTRLWRKGQKMRYFMSGEYGDKLQRPHFHYLIFGYEFPDKTPWRQFQGNTYYRSEELEKIWTFGNSLIGHVTVESAGYTARYVMKKQTGAKAKEHYLTDDGVTLHPEFSRMSLKPGIGAEWFRKYGESDIYNTSSDSVTINGTKYKTPRYYDTLLERLDVDKLMDVKSARLEAAQDSKIQENNTFERLAIRKEIHQRRITKLHRGYENGRTDY